MAIFRMTHKLRLVLNLLVKNITSKFVALFFITFVCSASEALERPNVILIVTDDQGYGDMACHGNPWLNTPNLDQMHSESVRLEDYHVDPVCTPSRAALLTGRHSLNTGAWAVTEGRQLLDPNETTMAQIFADSGYHTGMFGKWHLGDTYPYAPRFRGFMEVVCHRAGGIDEIGNPKGNNFFDDTLFRNGQKEKIGGYCTDVFFNETIRFIQQNKDSPFFVYLPLNAMHGPFNVAEKYSQRFISMGHPEERSKFYGMIENFDENLGRLFFALRHSRIEEDTIVIFMGDNGTAQGGNVESGGFNAGMRGKKGQVYEGGHRVACFVRWPAGLKAGKEVSQLTSNHDWLPTLIDICQLKRPVGVRFDGRSIAPLLRAEERIWEDRKIFIDRQGDQLEMSGINGPNRGQRYPQYAVLTERWRLVNGELYDIKSDPGQSNNIAKQHPNLVEDLYSAYREHYLDVTRHNGRNMPFYIGANEEHVTSITVRDWHPTNRRVIWKKEQLSDDTLSINGYWAIDVRKAGRYEFILTRHPLDDLKPIGAKRARIRLGDIDKEISLKPGDEQAVFHIDLTPRQAILQTWLTDDKTGKDRGAYYVTVSPL